MFWVHWTSALSHLAERIRCNCGSEVEIKVSLGGSDVKDLLAIQETWVRSPDQEDILEEGNGYQLQYSCLENSMEEEPGRVQSMGSQRVGYNWATNTFTFWNDIRKPVVSNAIFKKCKLGNFLLRMEI